MLTDERRAELLDADLLSPQEAAELLEITPQALEGWWRCGVIRQEKGLAVVRFTPKEVIAARGRNDFVSARRPFDPSMG